MAALGGVKSKRPAVCLGAAITAVVVQSILLFVVLTLRPHLTSSQRCQAAASTALSIAGACLIFSDATRESSGPVFIVAAGVGFVRTAVGITVMIWSRAVTLRARIDSDAAKAAASGATSDPLLHDTTADHSTICEMPPQASPPPRGQCDSSPCLRRMVLDDRGDSELLDVARPPAMEVTGLTQKMTIAEAREMQIRRDELERFLNDMSI